MSCGWRHTINSCASSNCSARTRSMSVRARCRSEGNFRQGGPAGPPGAQQHVPIDSRSEVRKLASDFFYRSAGSLPARAESKPANRSFLCSSIPLFDQPVNGHHRGDAEKRHWNGGEETGRGHDCAADERNGRALSPAVDHVTAGNRAPDARRPQVFLIQQIHAAHSMQQPCRPGQ